MPTKTFRLFNGIKSQVECRSRSRVETLTLMTWTERERDSPEFLRRHHHHRHAGRDSPSSEQNGSSCRSMLCAQARGLRALKRACALPKGPRQHHILLRLPHMASSLGAAGERGSRGTKSNEARVRGGRPRKKGGLTMLLHHWNHRHRVGRKPSRYGREHLPPCGLRLGLGSREPPEGRSTAAHSTSSERAPARGSTAAPSSL